MNPSSPHTDALLRDIVAQLTTSPMTAMQLSYRVDCNYKWASTLCNRLIDSGEIHIADWRRQGCRTSAVFAAGPGENIPQPPVGSPRKDAKPQRAAQAAGARAKRQKIAALATDAAPKTETRLGVWGL